MPQHPPTPRPNPGHGTGGAPPRPPWNDRRPGAPGPWPPPAGGPVPGPVPIPAPRPVPHGASPGGPDVSVPTGPEPKKPELTVTKVLAGAGAAATSAVLGSFFGADGTVYGAAFGSVASTVATTLYQRSLDRTRETLLARVRVRRPGGQDDSEVATVLLPRPAADGTPPDVRPDLPARPRPHWLLWAGVTALVFVIAMVVITGIELAKGSTLTGNDSGTSVGRVVAPPPKDPVPAEEAGSADTSTTEAPSTTDADSTATGTPAPAPGATEQDTQQRDEQQTQGGTDVAPTGADAPQSNAPAPAAPVGPKAGTNG